MPEIQPSTPRSPHRHSRLSSLSDPHDPRRDRDPREPLDGPPVRHDPDDDPDAGLPPDPPVEDPLDAPGVGEQARRDPDPREPPREAWACPDPIVTRRTEIPRMRSAPQPCSTPPYFHLTM